MFSLLFCSICALFYTYQLYLKSFKLSSHTLTKLTFPYKQYNTLIYSHSLNQTNRNVLSTSLVNIQWPQCDLQVSRGDCSNVTSLLSALWEPSSLTQSNARHSRISRGHLRWPLTLNLTLNLTLFPKRENNCLASVFPQWNIHSRKITENIQMSIFRFAFHVVKWKPADFEVWTVSGMSLSSLSVIWSSCAPVYYVNKRFCH